MKSALPCLLILSVVPSAAAAANLNIGSTWIHSPVIVYEFPEAEGRADAIQYVNTIRDELKRGVQVLDASANPASLPDKLKRGFILYTTLGEKSSLLRLATRKLGWRELATPSGETRLILVGQNPYSKGNCLIYAAGSNRALVDINAVSVDYPSYRVLQGSRVVREGNYDANFVLRESVHKAAALADMNQFFHTLQRVHPNLLGKVSVEDYRKLKEQTAAGIAAKLDSRGDIPAEDLASLLYYAAAYFKDGHTSVVWRTSPSDWNARGKRFPPFRLRFENGRFLIAAAKDPEILNMEIVTVNGMPLLEFLGPILDRCSGETPGFRAARFLGDEPFWYSLTNLFGADAPYKLGLRDAAGRDREVPLETLSFADYEALRHEGGEAPFSPNRQGTKVEFFDGGATAHFLYSSFALSAAEKAKVDHVFEEVKAKGARNLILDLRGNPGGQSPMAEEIFRHLYRGKFRAFRKVRARVSWDILSDMPWVARPLVVPLRGLVVGHGISERSFPAPAAFFAGRTYLLIDNGSFSMASSFAAMFRDYKVGTILGSESGGMPHTFGGPHHFTLKNSQIPCIVSWTENFPSRVRPGDEDRSVIPDVPLTSEKLADFKDEQDPVLAFTLRYVKSVK